MANISEFLLKIKEAVYGEEVRGSIHDALDAMNKECINAEATAISSRDSARHNAIKAEHEADRSEAWSVGNEKGEPVLPDSDQYRNNAKYWAEYAQRYAQGGVHWKGSINFSQIPEDDNLVGDMYSIKDKFTTDSRFEYGAGIPCPAGTNIIFREDGLWDLSPSTISGYSDAKYEKLEDAYYDINNLEEGQTVFVKQSRSDAYCNNLAPIEPTIVSSHQYKKGQRLVFNRIFFVALKNIAVGDNLIEGDNIQKTTVDSELQKSGSHIGMIIHTTTLDTEAKVKDVYGGESWIQHAGYFLRGASTGVTANQAQTDGGEDTHVLTVQEMPSHGHVCSAGGPSTNLESVVSAFDGNVYSNGKTLSTGAAGGGQAHNNIPAYKSVYIWERTA